MHLFLAALNNEVLQMLGLPANITQTSGKILITLGTEFDLAMLLYNSVAYQVCSYFKGKTLQKIYCIPTIKLESSSHYTRRLYISFKFSLIM